MLDDKTAIQKIDDAKLAEITMALAGSEGHASAKADMGAYEEAYEELKAAAEDTRASIRENTTTDFE